MAQLDNIQALLTLILLSLVALNGILLAGIFVNVLLFIFRKKNT